MNKFFQIKRKLILPFYLALFCSAFFSGSGHASYADESFKYHRNKNHVPWPNTITTPDDLKSTFTPNQKQQLKDAYEARKKESLEILKRELRNPHAVQNIRATLLNKFLGKNAANYIGDTNEEIRKKADASSSSQEYLGLLLTYHSLNNTRECKFYINRIAPPNTDTTVQIDTFLTAVKAETDETKLKVASILFTVSHPTATDAHTWHQAGEELLKTISGQAGSGVLNWAAAKVHIQKYANSLKDPSTYIGLAHYALKHNDSNFCVESLLAALKEDAKSSHHIGDFLALITDEKRDDLKELAKQCLLQNQLTLDPLSGKLLLIISKRDPTILTEAGLDLETGFLAWIKKNPKKAISLGMGTGALGIIVAAIIGAPPR